VAGLADSLGDEDDTPFEGSIAPISWDDVPSLVRSCEDIRALDPREDVLEHDIDATIASLEIQVDRLCSLLDNFRSEFQTKLHAFREDVRTLPERVGIAYSPQQRAYLLSMYGKSITESGELALHKLHHDLQHLISLEDDARPYEEYCSAESSFMSCRSEMDSAEVVPDQAPEKPNTRQPLTIRLLRASRFPALAPTPPLPVRDPPAIEVSLDNDAEHIPDQGEEQRSPAKPEGVALRLHREVTIDWERFCGDCPARASPLHCKGCSGWRRGFEDPTWDGRESRRESFDVDVSVEDFAW
jgi:hypothetical protein